MYIYVLLDNNGNYHIGRSSNAGKAIAEYNTDNNEIIKRVVGTKPVTKTRTIESVIQKFQDAGKTVIRAYSRRDKAIQKKSRRIDAAVAYALEKDED